MSIESRLEELRSKPEHEKKRFAFWSAFGICAVILAFWVGSFTVGGTSSEVATDTLDKADTPAKNLIAGMGGIYEDIKNIIFKPKTVDFQVEVIPGSR